MKYVIFREQVAERFDVGYRDVCIVGSAKLGFSPTPEKFGRSFHENSDVDVVIISEEWFQKGSFELFKSINRSRSSSPESHPRDSNHHSKSNESTTTDEMREAIRNYSYSNFNPGNLPDDNLLRTEIFEKISSTAGLFLALQPQVFVSKIRCRFFRTWKAAEDYYSNTLRQLNKFFIQSTESAD